jgi:hypothetical protein
LSKSALGFSARFGNNLDKNFMTRLPMIRWKKFCPRHSPFLASCVACPRTLLAGQRSVG